jgi:hypothetical protein
MGCPNQVLALSKHPTEQWVHTDLTVLTNPGLAACADACCTVPPVAAIAASPPIARPEPRRNARRSTEALAASDRILVRWERRAIPLVFFLNIVLSSLACFTFDRLGSLGFNCGFQQSGVTQPVASCRLYRRPEYRTPVCPTKGRHCQNFALSK